jgi:hypothetical protein
MPTCRPTTSRTHGLIPRNDRGGTEDRQRRGARVVGDGGTGATSPRCRNQRRPVTGKPAALVEWLKARRKDFWRFAVDFAVPFDNNPVERDLR